MPDAGRDANPRCHEICAGGYFFGMYLDVASEFASTQPKHLAEPHLDAASLELRSAVEE
jgi:hypothetical protein